MIANNIETYVVIATTIITSYILQEETLPDSDAEPAAVSPPIPESQSSWQEAPEETPIELQLQLAVLGCLQSHDLLEELPEHISDRAVWRNVISFSNRPPLPIWMGGMGILFFWSNQDGEIEHYKLDCTQLPFSWTWHF